MLPLCFFLLLRFDSIRSPGGQTDWRRKETGMTSDGRRALEILKESGSEGARRVDDWIQAVGWGRRGCVELRWTAEMASWIRRYLYLCILLFGLRSRRMSEASERACKQPTRGKATRSAKESGKDAEFPVQKRNQESNRNGNQKKQQSFSKNSTRRGTGG
ncbi:hypothetical protein IWX90DRAFT_442981, partial [Phyllosticta citrichinensis]